jgi:hypothetical protein
MEVDKLFYMPLKLAISTMRSFGVLDKCEKYCGKGGIKMKRVQICNWFL